MINVGILDSTYRPIRVGIIGYGRIGRIRADVIRSSEKSCVACIGDAKFDCDTVDYIMNDPSINAVVIATPTKYHMSLAIEALKAGKHVLCEKPLGRNLKEAESIFRAVPAGQVLHLGFNYRHLAHVRKAKEMIESGYIGTPMFFRSRFGNGGRPDYHKEWCTQKEQGGGVVIEQAIHIFDLVSFLFDEPKYITAITCNLYHDLDTEDNLFCTIETLIGIAQIHVSWTQWVNLFEVEIFGTKGYIKLLGRDGSYGQPRLFYGTRNQDHSRPIENEIGFNTEDSWTLDWAEFESEIEKKVYDVSPGLKAQRIVDAAYESAECGSWITI